MGNRITPEQEDVIIEDALKNIPLASMPCSITVNVMTHIQKDGRPALITWNDFALSLIITSCVAALFFALQSLPPILVAKLRIQEILLYQNILVNVRWLAPVLLFGLAAFLSALTIQYLLQMTIDNKR